MIVMIYTRYLLYCIFTIFLYYMTPTTSFESCARIMFVSCHTESSDMNDSVFERYSQPILNITAQLCCSCGFYFFWEASLTEECKICAQQSATFIHSLKNFLNPLITCNRACENRAIYASVIFLFKKRAFRRTAQQRINCLLQTSTYKPANFAAKNHHFFLSLTLDPSHRYHGPSFETFSPYEATL